MNHDYQGFTELFKYLIEPEPKEMIISSAILICNKNGNKSILRFTFIIIQTNYFLDFIQN